MTLKTRQLLSLITPEISASFQLMLAINDECLEYQGLISPQGYGLVRIGRQQVLAHRLAWTLATGKDIPRRKIICHKCDNERCCNVNHLYVGTHKTNAQDASKALRYGSMAGKKGPHHPRSKPDDQRRKAILMRAEAIGFAEIARELGCHRQTAERWWREHEHALSVARALRPASRTIEIDN